MTTERTALERIVSKALAKGWLISVYDGEEWAVKFSTDAKAIIDAATSVDECTLSLRTKAPRMTEHGMSDRVGKLYLVWGNDPQGSELISDYTFTPEVEAFVQSLGLGA